MYFSRNDFIEKLVVERGADLSATMKMKLLNINSSTDLLENYKGIRLASNSTIFDLPITYSKNKQILVNGLLDALKSLLTSETYVKTHVDTKMGFVIGK